MNTNKTKIIVAVIAVVVLAVLVAFLITRCGGDSNMPETSSGVQTDPTGGNQGSTGTEPPTGGTEPSGVATPDIPVIPDDPTVTNPGTATTPNGTIPSSSGTQENPSQPSTQPATFASGAIQLPDVDF